MQPELLEVGHLLGVEARRGRERVRRVELFDVAGRRHDLCIGGVVVVERQGGREGRRPTTGRPGARRRSGDHLFDHLQLDDLDLDDLHHRDRIGRDGAGRRRVTG